MISVCILAKNAERTLGETLDSLVLFPEIILLDTGSADRTLSIARTFPNVTASTSPFIGFGPLRNKAAALATHDWILAVDSDERLSPSLQQEILALTLNPKTVYSIPRHNFYRGKRIKGCCWHPDRVVRLYHRQNARYDDQAVHEQVCIGVNQVSPLASPLLHTPYREVSDFLAKMQLYSSLFAEQQLGKLSASKGKAIRHGLFAFMKSYFLKGGFLDGMEGVEISWYNANTAFYKYLKLYELTHSKSASES